MRNDLTFSCRISQNITKKVSWIFECLILAFPGIVCVRFYFRLSAFDKIGFYDCRTNDESSIVCTHNGPTLSKHTTNYAYMAVWRVAVMALWTQRRNPTRFKFWKRSGTTLSHHSHRCMLPVSAAQHTAALNRRKHENNEQPAKMWKCE